MKLEEVIGKNVDVEKLPDEIHMQLTVHKLANELISTNTRIDTLLQSDNIEEIKHDMMIIKLHNTGLVATMIHLFDWIDFGDILDKSSFRKQLEDNLKIEEKIDLPLLKKGKLTEDVPNGEN